MGEVKQINIKNRTYYFYNNTVDLKNFVRFLKVDQKKKEANCNNINSINPLYLMINEVIGHFEEKNENKYLILDDVDENKEVSKKYEDVQKGVKKKLKQLMVAKKLNMEKIFKKLGCNQMMICL